MNDGHELSPQLKIAVTNAFNEGLRQLIGSVHSIMPDDAIMLNVITCVFIARRECGFTDEQTRDEISTAVNAYTLMKEKIR